MKINLQYFGGRGASLGINFDKDKPYDKEYGSEYSTIAQFGNVKIIKKNDGSATAPMETRTRGRVYATLDKNNNLKAITFYDDDGLRTKQIDMSGNAHDGIKPPHTHVGYEHDEDGFHKLTEAERKIVNKIVKDWERRRKELGM